MRCKLYLVFLLFVGAVLAATAQTAAPPQNKVSMTVNASKTGEPIHRYVYGQFSELLFNLFEKGLWSEMISDRKFFYRVDSSEKIRLRAMIIMARPQPITIATARAWPFMRRKSRHSLRSRWLSITSSVSWRARGAR
jgi:hypothetical protein